MKVVAIRTEILITNLRKMSRRVKVKNVVPIANTMMRIHILQTSGKDRWTKF